MEASQTPTSIETRFDLQWWHVQGEPMNLVVMVVANLRHSWPQINQSEPTLVTFAFEKGKAQLFTQMHFSMRNAEGTCNEINPPTK